MTRPRWIAAGLIVAAVAVGLGIGGARGAAPAAPPAVTGVPRVPLVPVAFATYVVRVHASGRVGPPTGGDARLAFAQSGIVGRIDVRVGDRVGAGQPLAELDASGLALDAAQARSDAVAAAANDAGGAVPSAALASAQARLTAARDRLRAIVSGAGGAQSERAAAFAALRQSRAKSLLDERSLERMRALYAGGVAAWKDVEAARAQVAYDRADAAANAAKSASAQAAVGGALTQARADFAQARSDVRTAQAQRAIVGAQAASARARADAAARLLALATLRAPADGVVTAILKHPGEAVDPSQPAVVVGPPMNHAVTLTLGGDDARAVRPGDPVALAAAGASGTGRVRSVVPGVDPATQTTTVVVDGIPPGAQGGDAVDATIEVGRRRGLVIPTAAIVEDPQTGRAIVFVREGAANGEASFVSRAITVGAGDDLQTLVTAGLHAGERIAGQGAFDLLAPGGG